MKTRVRSLYLFSLMGVLFLAVAEARAVSKTWTNPVSGNWTNAANWTPIGAPSIADEVFITVNGPTNYMVTLSTNATIASLTLGAVSGVTTQTLVITASRSLTLTNASVINGNGVLSLTGGTVAGSGELNNRGTIDSQAGAINTPLINQRLIVFHGLSSLGGSYQNAAGATNRVLRDTAGGIVRATAATSFTNNGIIELNSAVSGSAEFFVSNGTLVNGANGQISILAGAGGTRQISAELDNRGTMTIDGALTLFQSSVHHANSGTINVSGGDFILTQSGGGASFTNSGTVNIASGRTWTVGGGALNNGGQILGPGTLNVDHATAKFSPNFSTAITGLQMDGAVINGPGTVTNVPGKALDCSASTINAPLINQGLLLFRGQCGLSNAFQNTAASTNRLVRDGIGGFVGVIAASGFTNNGIMELTATVSGSVICEVNAGTLVNAPGARIDILAGAGGTRQINAEIDNRSVMTIDQELTLFKSSVHHTNSGTINVAGGDFILTQSGGTASFANSGTVNIASGHTWTVGGGTLNNDGQVLGPGTLNVDHATANLTPNFSTAITGLRLDTAVINGPGTVTNVPGKALDCNASTLNARLINQGLLLFHGQCGLSNAFQNTAVSTNRIVRDAVGGFVGVIAANGFTNNGIMELTATVSGSVFFEVSTGAILNAAGGYIDILPGAGGTRQINAEIDNRGTITIGQTLTIVKGSVRHINSGLITLTGGDLNLTQSGGPASFTNTGTINIAAGQTFLAGGGTLQNAPAGIVQGFGTLSLTNIAFTNAGNFNPGTSPGTLTVVGNFPQIASGNLNIELGGLNQGTQYDFLNVSNVVTLGGSLNVRFLNGFQTTVSSNDVFTVMRGATLSGVFTNVANGSRLFTSDGFGSFIVTYTPASKTVVLSAFEPILPVTADFNAGPIEGVVPLMVLFTNLTSGTAGTYLWNFGDGATSSSINPSHTYTNSGIYTVSLRSSGLGGTNTLTKTNLITVRCALTCPADIVVSTAPGQCGVVVNYPPPTTLGDCGPLIFNPPSGSFLPKGLNLVTLTNNNGVGCSFTVTVQDRELPAIVCPVTIVRSTDPGRCFASNITFSATATDNCPGVTVVSTPPSGSTFSKGTNVVTCRATDAAGNTNACSFLVIVRDTQPPVISCPTNLVFNANPGSCSRSNITFIVTATDNCDSSVSVQCTPPSGSTFPVGVTTVQCVATDHDNNTSTCSFTVTVRDVEAPAIRCPANFTLQANSGQHSRSNVTFNATATDACDGSVTVICAPPSGSTFPVGATQVRCTASDRAGNTNNCSFTVTITAAPIAISGRVTNCVTGAVLAGVRVRATGVSLPVLTDASGSYLFPSVPVADTVSISPEFPSAAFTPGTSSFTRPTNNLTVNFCATLQLSISGVVRDGSGLAVSGTTLRLSGGLSNTTTTDSSGAYAFRNVPGGNITVTPTNGGWVFTPTNRSFANITANQIANFSGLFPPPPVTNLPGKIALDGRSILSGDAILSGPSTLILNDDGSRVLTPLGPEAPSGHGDSNFAWTKDGSKLAFRREIGPFATTAICTMNADGTGLRQLTVDTPPSGECSWSPDGSQIAYRSSGSYPGEITIMNADGSNSHIIVHNASGGPVWSPDGRRIAFIRDTNPQGPIQAGRIFTVSTNGTDLAQVNTLPVDDISGLSWSPDGTRFGYSAWRNIPRSGPQYISIINTNGGNPLVTLSNVSTLGMTEPICWSPDSSRIALHQSGNLYSAKPDGTDRRLLLNKGRLSGFQSWGPQATSPVARGTNVVTQSGGTSLTFSNVTTPGDTAVVPLSAQAPALPQGYFNLSGFSAFDVVSSANFSGPIVLTFRDVAPSVTSAADFARLRILHGENGVLVDRTILPPDSPAPDFATHTISARVPSLSPIAIAQQFVASLPQIIGKVVDENGAPLGGANITLSGDSQASTVTDINGQFSFPNQAANGNYTLGVTGVGHLFNPPTMDLARITNSVDVLFVGVTAPLPPLTIARDPRFNNQPTLTWSGGTFDFVLESVDSIPNTNWIVAPESFLAQPVETGVAVPLAPTAPERFFRLRRPTPP